MTTPPDFRTWLEQLAAAEALVPARVVLARLGEAGQEEAPRAAAVVADLTVEELAAELRRGPSTVRGWLGAGEFPGAYRMNGREWRIPRGDVAAYLDRQRPVPVVESASPVRSKKSVDLGSWRQHVRKSQPGEPPKAA
jgi:excisionase family DNA binding protein